MKKMSTPLPTASLVADDYEQRGHGSQDAPIAGGQQSIVMTARTLARDALRLICLEQLHAVERHWPGARLGRDPEALHDLRVAVRRTRSLLSEFRKCFPHERIEHFRREFRWVGEISGLVRDLDVYLEHLPDYAGLLSSTAGDSLAPFRRFLRHHRRLEQRRLIRRLDSKRFEKLLADWQGFLAGTDDNLWPEAAIRPMGEVARRRIWKLYRAFIHQGEAIAADTPDQALHRLRITGKKLRYLVEFFRPLSPTAESQILVKAMKDIQDFLGAYQDCTVQQLRLREMARQMVLEGTVPVSTTAALTRLIEILRQRQQRLRCEFPQRFAIFCRGRGRRGFARLFAPAEKG